MLNQSKDSASHYENMAARGRGSGNSRTRNGRLNNPSNTLVEPDLSSHTKWEGEGAPRDTSEPGSVAYPLNAEGGLNKFHASYKKARNEVGIDNIMHRNTELYYTSQICNKNTKLGSYL